MIRLLFLLLLLAFNPASHLAAAQPDRHPVLLRKSWLLPPYESAGTGLAPEVKVKVELDRRGLPAKVTVVGISPSSELDEVFRRRTIEEIRTWRWAPAIENGKAAAATLEWTVQFKVKEGSLFGGPSRPPLPVDLDLKERSDRRKFLRALPTNKKREILERYAQIAEKHLETNNRRQAGSSNFVVVTDSDHEGTAEIVARNLEVAFTTVRSMHQPEIEPIPHELRTLVYLYRTKAAFEAMRRELNPLTQQLATYYAPGLIVFTLEVPSSEYLLSFLIHEASHAYSDHHLRRAGAAFPRWFEEGFAEYMGNSEVKKGKLVPGRVLKRSYGFDISHYDTGVRLKKTVAGWDLETVKRRARRGESMTLRQLVDAEAAEFYTDFQIHYGTAWLFVHFLRHGKPEWENGRFASLVLYLAEGYSDEEAITAVYGLSIAELEGPFREYVKAF